MNKRLQLLFLSYNAVGYVVLAVTRLFGKHFSDFFLGFLEGFAIVSILAGFIFLLWCMTNKKTPHQAE